MTRRQQKRRNVNPVPAIVEAVEPRLLLSATMSGNGTWTIRGTNASDEIFVSRDETDSSYLLVEVNGQVVDYQPADDVAKIVVLGRRGHDYIEISESAGPITIPTVLRGQGGHDTIIGGSGNDRIYGNGGRDELEGNDGDEYLFTGLILAGVGFVVR